MSQDAAAAELQQWYESDRDTVTPRPPEERWAPPDWMALAIRLCRDGGDGLASYFRRVPESYCRADGVECVCGEPVTVEARAFVECPGGCGRWFVADDGEVWAARLPVEAPDEPAVT